MKKITNYFGTTVTNHGHFMFDVSDCGTYFGNMNLNMNRIPFSPEHICQNMSNGEISFLHHITKRFGEITILAIVGSPKDDRPGCKSVFWIYEKVCFETIKQMILDTPCCNEIIDKMPFPIRW